MDESQTAREYPPLVGLFAAFGVGTAEEPAPPRADSSIETMPCSNRSFDSLPPPSSARPDWCVDLGAEMLTMTTFELWAAIERGQAVSSTRVWREGMECWTPLEGLREFSMALASTPHPVEPVRFEAPPRLVVVEEDDDGSSLPPAVESAWRHHARWVAAGAAVAAAAMGLAFFQLEPAPTQEAPVEPAIVGELRVTPPGPADILGITGFAPQPDDAPLPILAEELRGRHGEPGQRRLPRTGKSGYGR